MEVRLRCLDSEFVCILQRCSAFVETARPFPSSHFLVQVCEFPEIALEMYVKIIR